MPDLVSVGAPRRVFCVLEHKHRSQAVADAVVAGRFPIQGVTIELGVEPDWLAASLPRDKEWRLEWSKFYYGLDLAAAAERTGASVYPTTWMRLVASWIERVPVDHDPSDVVGRRIQNWIYAWSRFAERFDLESAMPGFEARITGSLRAQIAHLRRHLTRERNHRTLELYALFVAALAMPALDAEGELLRFAVDALTENLIADVLPDGVQRERSTHYHHVVLRSFVGLRENARRFGIEVPATFDERLSRACEFALHCHRPDGAIPALSDSDSGSYLDLLELAGELLVRPDFTYVGTRSVSGTAPHTTCASFPDGGYFVERSGWGTSPRDIADERYLIFDCGALGDGGHGHYDALSVEIAAYGGPLVIDPGRYTYSDDPWPWRRWFKGTAAHNTVTVDRVDQTPYRRGRPGGPVAQAHLLQRFTAPGLDLLWGEATSPLYEVVHRRRIFFVAGEYWLIEDALEGARPHRYQLRFHLTPEQSHVTIVGSECGCRADTPRMSVVLAGGATATVEPGWVSFDYGVKHAAPVVTFTADAMERTRLITLVSPRVCPAQPPPELRVRFEDRLAIADVIRTVDGAVHDRIVWAVDGAAAPIEGVEEAAFAVWTRRTIGGDIAGRVPLTAAARTDAARMSTGVQSEVR